VNEVSMDQVFILFTVLWLGLLFVLWFRSEVKHSNHNWTTAKDNLYNCPKCHQTFLAPHDTENITRCPRCNEMCFLKRRKYF